MVLTYDANIIKEMKDLFTIVEIDFYNNGEDVETFVFRASEMSEEKVWELWEDYDNKYNNDEFDGAWEDYLSDKGIKYATL
jgi:hypothetical protein